MSYVLTLKAEEELAQIWHYIALDNEAAADRFTDKLAARMELLADMPAIGRKRDDIRAGYRSLSVGNYVIFYRIAEHDIHIMHVVHGKRDLEDYPFQP